MSLVVLEAPSNVVEIQKKTHNFKGDGHFTSLTADDLEMFRIRMFYQVL